MCWSRHRGIVGYPTQINNLGQGKLTLDSFQSGFSSIFLHFGTLRKRGRQFEDHKPPQNPLKVNFEGFSASGKPLRTHRRGSVRSWGVYRVFRQTPTKLHELLFHTINVRHAERENRQQNKFWFSSGE